MTADVTKSLVLALLRRSVGRRNLIRVGRYLTRGGQLDVRNDPESNGERTIQEIAIRAMGEESPLVLFDVGAHRGSWLFGALSVAGESGIKLDLHAFEPDSDAFQLLEASVQGLNGSRECVHLNRRGASAQGGKATFYRYGGAVGVNGLHRLCHIEPREEVEIEVVRLDEYAKEQAIRHIHFLKIDAEGHDFDVIRGTEGMLRCQAIDFVQFEYNARWILNRRFLRDAFELFLSYGYRLGKITPYGVEKYSRWDPDLETFVEGNYLAFNKRSGNQIPLIHWWKET